ncbi:hypothetical protein HDZ31DRAFT_44594 [Schizophyllum fasciatum]
MSACGERPTDETPCANCNLHSWMHVFPDLIPRSRTSFLPRPCEPLDQLPSVIYEQTPSHWLEGRGVHKAPSASPAPESRSDLAPEDVLCEFDRTVEEVCLVYDPFHRSPIMISKLFLRITPGIDDTRPSHPPRFLFQCHRHLEWNRHDAEPHWVRWEAQRFSFVESRVVVAVMLFGVMSAGGMYTVERSDWRWEPLIWLCTGGPLISISRPLLIYLSHLVWRAGPSQWRFQLRCKLMALLIPYSYKIVDIGDYSKPAGSHVPELE